MRTTKPFSLRKTVIVYLVLIIIVAAIASSFPNNAFSLLLLPVLLFVTIRRVSPRISVLLCALIVFTLPVILAATLEHITALSEVFSSMYSGIAVVPAAVYLLDLSLRHYAEGQPLSAVKRKGRAITLLSRTLLLSVLLILAAAAVLNIPALLVAGSMFALYLAIMMSWSLVAIPPAPVHIAPLRRRVVAGTTDSLSLELVSRVKQDIHCALFPAEDWVIIRQSRFLLGREPVKVTLDCTPPLAGPSNPRIDISLTDRRGLIQVSTTCAPAEMHIIPRARYAEWLAARYLAQSGGGTTAFSSSQPRNAFPVRKGLDYEGSRTYQPGDQLKEIDWKHTTKLSQLIINEFKEAGGQPAIIAVNLSTGSAEGIDKLAFDLVTTTLTLCRVDVPTALVAYNHETVVLSTPVASPQEILRRCLSLLKEITIIEIQKRYLDSVDISRLRRNISFLKQAESEPASRLLDLLHFERSALEGTARDHPASSALAIATGKVAAPAMVLLITELNHDIEAVLINMDRLSRKHYTVVPVHITR